MVMSHLQDRSQSNMHVKHNKCPGACRPYACKPRRVCLWTTGAARSTVERPLAQRVISSGKPGRRETLKIVLLMLTCPGSIGSVSHRMFCSKKKWSSACGLYLLASLNSLVVARTRMTSKALRHESGPPFCSSIFGRNSPL